MLNLSMFSKQYPEHLVRATKKEKKIEKEKTKKTELGLERNVEALLSYLLGWVTGIIFLIVEKDEFVKFHALQSVIIFGFFTVLFLIFKFIPIIGVIINIILFLLSLIVWVVSMIKAYQGEKFKWPFAGEIAEKGI